MPAGETVGNGLQTQKQDRQNRLPTKTVPNSSEILSDPKNDENF